MRILVGNNHLVRTGGTENYTFALATILKEQGHEVEYFAFEKGFVAGQLELRGIPFMSHTCYDLILANHTSVVEYLYLSGYIIQTCHGILPDLEQPSPYADRHVSISKEIQQYLQRLGYESEVMLNGIDCERFAPNNPIHQKLTCVLSLCQSGVANAFIQECCESVSGEKIKFISCNKFTDNVWEIEEVINQADLVVGIGRSLYDAMACGRCVISYDFRPFHRAAVGDGYLSSDNIEQSIIDNCIGRSSNKVFTKEAFVEELRKYNPEDGAWTRRYALENLNMRKSAQRYIGLNGNTTNIRRQKIEKIRTLKFPAENCAAMDRAAYAVRKSMIKDKRISKQVVKIGIESYWHLPFAKRRMKLVLKYFWYRMLK